MAKKLSISVDDELHKRLRMRAAQVGRSQQEVLVNLLESALDDSEPSLPSHVTGLDTPPKREA